MLTSVNNEIISNQSEMAEIMHDLFVNDIEKYCYFQVLNFKVF